MSAVFIVVALGNTLSGLGLAPTIIQKKDLTEDHLATALVSSLGIGLTLMTLQWLCAPYLAAFMRMPELINVTRVTSLALIVQPLASLYEAWMARCLRFRQVSITKLGVWIASSFGVSIPLAYLGYGYWALAAGFLSQTFFSAATYLLLARNIGSNGDASFRAAKELFRTGAGFSVTQFMNYISIYADNTIVGRALGSVDLGIYSRAFYMISLPTNMFGTASRMVVFPAMAHIQDDESRMRQAYLKGISLTALMAIPTSVFLAVFSGEIVSIILGSQWTKATIPFAVFSTAIYFRVGAKTCANILLAKAHAYTLAILQTANAVMIVAGALIGASYGLNTVCIAVCTAAIVSYGGYAIISNRTAKVTILEFASVHIRPILIGLFVLSIGTGLKLAMPEAKPITVIGCAIVAFGLPLGVALYLKPSFLLGNLVTEILATVAKPFAQKIGWRVH